MKLEKGVLMLKECEICGAKFETINRIRKYCDDCQQHTNKNRNKVERGLRHIAALTYEPKIIEITCEDCGRTITTVSKCRIIFYDRDGVRHLFCSQKCRDHYIRHNDTCKRCGKQFSGDMYEVTSGMLYGNRYCSEECYEKAKEEHIRENWIRCTCSNCKKVFYKPKLQTFCSTECYREAVKNGWRPTKKVEPEVTTIRRRCEICKTMFFQELRPNKEISPVCSDRCRRERKSRLIALREKT